MKRFELWLANLSPYLGGESSLARPVVIIQTDLLNEVYPSTIVCPLTNNFKDDVEILRIRVESVHLSHKSDVMVDHIITLDNRRFIKKIGKLTPKQIERLTYSLKVILDL